MAAAAFASVPTSIAPEFNSILTCVRELYTTFEWRKKLSDITSLRECLMNIATKQGISMKTMEQISLEHAKNYTSIFGGYKYIPYSTMERKSEITSINYISVPYQIYLSEDNTTWIIFRTASKYIPKITPEMMDIIKFLGVVRVYISYKFEKAIPYFPDNVIQIEFESRNSLTRSNEIKFGIPQYLLGFYDLTKIYTPIPLGYTTRLPNTLIELITSELHTPNLPQNLTLLKYLTYYRDDDLTLPESFFQMIPLSVKSLTLSNFRCHMMDYTMIQGMEYLELDIGHVNGNIIRFDNVNTIKIDSFLTIITICPKHNPYIKTVCNLVKTEEYPCQYCDDGTDVIRYTLSNFIVSLGATVEHLILSGQYCPRDRSLDILKYLDTSTPNNLQSITISEIIYNGNIKTYDDVLQRQQFILKKLESKLESRDSKYDLKLDLETLEIIINFHKRFPDVKIIILE